MFSSSILRPRTTFVPFSNVYRVMLHRDWSNFLIFLIFFSVIDGCHFLDNGCWHFLVDSAFWTPRSQPEGSYKIGSICLSFCMSVSFLRIGSLVSSDTQHGVRGPYIVMCDGAGFFWESIPIRQKWPKMVQNGPKTWFLDFLRKSCH